MRMQNPIRKEEITEEFLIEDAEAIKADMEKLTRMLAHTIEFQSVKRGRQLFHYRLDDIRAYLVNLKRKADQLYRRIEQMKELENKRLREIGIEPED